MKKYFLFFIFFLPNLIEGQEVNLGQIERQTNEGNSVLMDTLTPLLDASKISLLRDVNVIFNSRFAFKKSFVDDEHFSSNFAGDQFRFEIKGKIKENINFRFRTRYTRESETGNIDNISRAIDLAFVRIDLSPRTNLAVGKLVADFGGWEFDMNPIYILAYNDIINNSDNFLVGAEVYHNFSDNKNSVSFQIMNSRTKTFEEQYGSSAPPSINPSKFPLAFVTNWRSSFFKGKLKTTYSYSFFNEAQGTFMNYVALGHKFKVKKLVLFYDFQYSYEGLDRRKVISNIISSQNQYAAKNAIYIGNWVRAEYLATPKINLVLTLMTTDFYWKDNSDSNGTDKLSTSYGIIPTVEYFPFPNLNMRFYVGYVARKYNYTSYAETEFGVKDYKTGLFSIGIIAPFLVL